MTQDEQITRTHSLVIGTANKLAEAGLHPLAIVEGVLAAALHLQEPVLGRPALVAWLRDAADTIAATIRTERDTLQ